MLRWDLHELFEAQPAAGFADPDDEPGGPLARAHAARARGPGFGDGDAGSAALHGAAEPARDAMRAIDAAFAAGVRSSGLAFCRAQLVALNATRADDALALMREHAREHCDDLGACLAFLRAAQLHAARDAQLDGADRGADGGDGALSDARPARRGGTFAFGASAREDAMRSLAHAALGVLRLDPSSEAAHESLWRGVRGCEACAGAPPALASSELARWAGERVEYAPESADAWCALVDALRRLTRELLEREPSLLVGAANEGAAAEGAAAAGTRAVERRRSDKAGKKARKQARRSALGAALPLGLVSGSEWDERLRWWPSAFFRPAVFDDGGLLRFKLAVCAMLYGRQSAFLQRALFAHACLDDVDTSERAATLRDAVRHVRKAAGADVSELCDRAEFGALAASRALGAAHVNGEFEALLADWSELCARVAHGSPPLPEVAGASEAELEGEPGAVAGVRRTRYAALGFPEPLTSEK